MKGGALDRARVAEAVVPALLFINIIDEPTAFLSGKNASKFSDASQTKTI
jgi:hypothetical protein